jgi:hypothetical protein
VTLIYDASNPLFLQEQKSTTKFFPCATARDNMHHQIDHLGC